MSDTRLKQNTCDYILLVIVCSRAIFNHSTRLELKPSYVPMWDPGRSLPLVTSLVVLLIVPPVTTSSSWGLISVYLFSHSSF